MIDPDKTKKINNSEIINKCKFGITKKPKNRIKAYKTACPKVYFETCWCIYESKNEVLKIEKDILKNISDLFIVESEYINGYPKLVINFIESYFLDHEILTIKY